MDVSIIIVNFNTVNLLIEAIDSIKRKSTGFSYEIIVVDNNSTDNSQQILFERFYSKIIYLPLPENIGFGKANNEGIKIAKGRNIFFLNPDTQLINNAIKILLDFIDIQPNVGIVGGNLYSLLDKQNYSYCRPLPGILTDELSLLTFGLSRKFIKHPYHNATLKPCYVGGISGADLMIRRSVLDEVGNFDPQFFMYYEDTDLNWRVKQAGYKVINVPSAKIMHLDSQSFKFKETKMRLSLESRAKYYTKVKGKLYCQLADMLLLFAINFNIFILNLAGKDNSFYKQYRLLVQELYFNK